MSSPRKPVPIHVMLPGLLIDGVGVALVILGLTRSSAMLLWTGVGVCILSSFVLIYMIWSYQQSQK
jgi:hypothetical protein